MASRAMCSILIVVALLVASSFSIPTSDHGLYERQDLSLSSYAPETVQCPSTPLVRPANGISSQESDYISSRKSKADRGLARWLRKQGKFSTSSQPVVGFSSSGGGYRALLETAGVFSAFDSRDTNLGTSGIFQGLTYQAGLSGGSWFLSSLAGNNWPTVSSLKTGLWEQAFQASLIAPPILLSAEVRTLICP